MAIRPDYAVGKRFRGLIVRAQNGRCAACGQPLNLARNTKPTHEDFPTLDHLRPRAKGGADHPHNKVAMHRKCNRVKADRMPTGCEIIHGLAVRAALDEIFARMRRQKR